jgi:two-component system, response regulator
MKRTSVLLVDDDPAEVELALRAFRKQGIADEVDEVAVARDGEEALDYLFCRGTHAERDPSAAPEFVLLDVKLPKLNGVEVLERIRADERTKLLPVVMYSSSGEDEDVRTAYEAGANSYVTKPSNFERFSEAMRSLGWYWLEWNVCPPPS